MQFKDLLYAVGITTRIVSIIALPIVGESNLTAAYIHLLFWLLTLMEDRRT